jgi:phospholipid/cholesterol/gamma-HCH transport system permease protein
VRGGADSVGRQTTVSVVQSIFMVIAADALFSVVLGGVGLMAVNSASAVRSGDRGA